MIWQTARIHGLLVTNRFSRVQITKEPATLELSNRSEVSDPQPDLRESHQHMHHARISIRMLSTETSIRGQAWLPIQVRISGIACSCETARGDARQMLNNIIASDGWFLEQVSLMVVVSLERVASCWLEHELTTYLSSLERGKTDCGEIVRSYRR